MNIIRWACFWVVAILLISFAVSNDRSIELRLWPLPDSVFMPIILITGLMFILGFILGGLASFASRNFHRSGGKSARKQVVPPRGVEPNVPRVVRDAPDSGKLLPPA